MLKIQLKENQKLFFCSDTHFSHINICKGTTKWDTKRAENAVRNFNTISEMNETILGGINDTVGQDDVLIHLGDFSFNGFENIKIFRDRIICKNVYIITGNHDLWLLKNKENIRDIFTQVIEFYTQLEIIHPHNQITKMVLCHFPIASWEDMSKGRIHIYGHTHLPFKHKLGPGKSLDCGVDGNNFKPYELKEILNLMDKQPISSLCLPIDHHMVEVKK